MPKKSEFLPPPKPDSHPEEAAILTRIFKKEPLITYRDLLDKYKSEVSTTPWASWTFRSTRTSWKQTMASGSRTASKRR